LLCKRIGRKELSEASICAFQFFDPFLELCNRDAESMDGHVMFLDNALERYVLDVTRISLRHFDQEYRWPGPSRRGDSEMARNDDTFASVPDLQITESIHSIKRKENPSSRNTCPSETLLLEFEQSDRHSEWPQT
jgi:hypothetical protein